MTDIRVHPSLVDDTEENERTTALFVECGLMKEGDRFVADPNMPDDEDDDDDKVDPAFGNTCKDICRTAYEAAKLVCQGTFNYSKCRKKAKKAYEACLAVCDLNS